jgi:signal transduction histidine kinase
LPPIAGDSNLLKQALLNLLSNSADAIAREGTTESAGDTSAAADGRGNRGRRRGQSGKIELEGRVRLVPEGEPVVELTVSDNGPGVDGHSPSQVLEPFFTTKREGLGMGLPIALSIAEEHGGRLVLDNNPGSGLRVSLQIPVWNNKDFE